MLLKDYSLEVFYFYVWKTITTRKSFDNQKKCVDKIKINGKM